MALNPIIPGFSPDPSIVRVNGWYYLVTSTFHCFPGLPIYASQDLVSWKHIGNGIHRQGQLSLAKSSTNLHPQPNGEVLLATGGLYAPTLRYYNGIFYLVCTNIVRKDVDPPEDAENFIITCDDIWKCNWSDPVYFDFRGIDPSLFWDDDGKAYIQGSRGPGPATTINQFEIDLTTGHKMSEERMIWRGTGGIYPEGPHLYKKDGWYYLEISEGGTHGGHCVTMARSQDIWGPYQACLHNPVLTARETDEYIQYTGHCDVFQGENDQWWGVCLGVRKDKDGRFILGRETFITPGTWDGDWLALDRVKTNPEGLAKTGTEDALTAIPGVDWLYIRDALLKNYELSPPDGATLMATQIDLTHPETSPSFIGKRQRQLFGLATTTLAVPALHTKIKAGIAIYKDEHRWVRIYFDTEDNAMHLELLNTAKEITREERQPVSLSAGADLTLRVEYTEKEYRFSFDDGDGKGLVNLGCVDTMDLTGPDFVGPVIGVFAVAQEDVEAKIAFKGIVIE